MTIKVILCLLVGYFCGAFSTAYVVGATKHMDIRNYGSGNAGTTNAIRTLGKKLGLLVFAGDFLKVLIPTLIVRFVVFGGQPYAHLMCLLTGLGAVIGHCFPVWLRFKGGKGIAVTAGAMVSSDVMNLIFLPAFFLIVFITKYVSLGSIFVVTVFPIFTALRFYGEPYYWQMIVVCCLYTISGIYMHRANIKRLMNGTENKIGHRVKIEESTDNNSAADAEGDCNE